MRAVGLGCAGLAALLASDVEQHDRAGGRIASYAAGECCVNRGSRALATTTAAPANVRVAHTSGAAADHLARRPLRPVRRRSRLRLRPSTPAPVLPGAPD
jgi:hypothetical protein